MLHARSLLLLALAALWPIMLVCQIAPKADTDIVEKLMPRDFPPKVVPLSPKEQAVAIKQLKTVQLTATGKRSQDIAFLLAALGSDYEKNRDYLIKAFGGCSSPEIKYGLCSRIYG